MLDVCCGSAGSGDTDELELVSGVSFAIIVGPSVGVEDNPVVCALALDSAKVGSRDCSGADGWVGCPAVGLTGVA